MGSGGEKLDEPRAAGARADGDDKHAKAAAQSAAAGGGSELAALVLSLALWPAIVALPLALTYGECYAALWPERWYADDAASGGGGAAAAMPWRDGGDWPSPLGLSLGLLAVAVGMCATLAYQAARYFGVGPIGRAPRTAVQARASLSPRRAPRRLSRSSVTTRDVEGDPRRRPRCGIFSARAPTSVVILCASRLVAPRTPRPLAQSA